MRIDISQLKFISPYLRQIVQTVEHDLGIDFTVTSLFRIGDKGVHGTLPLRGIDFRMKVYSVGKAIEDYINGKWFYDQKRPWLRVAKFHKVKNGEWHLHLQVHKNSGKY